MAEYTFETDKECENCVENKAGIAHCTNCNRVLCEECLEWHKRQVDTKDHRVIESESAIEWRKRSKCTEHQKEIKFYCCDCEKPICIDCTMTCCDGHKKNVANDVKGLLRDNFPPIKEKATEFESHWEHIKSVKEKNDTEVTRCEQDINQTFADMIEQMKEKKEQLIRELREANNQQQENVRQHEEDVKRKWEELKENIRGTEELLTTRQDSKLMIKRDEQLAKMKGLSLCEWSTELVKPTQWQIRTQPKEQYADKFGQLLPKPELGNIIVRMEERATVGETNEFTIKVEPLEQIRRCKVDKEISVKLVLNPSTNSGSPGRSQGTLLHRTVKKVSENVWSVSYFPRSCGELSVAVAVCGIEAGEIPFSIQVEDRIKKGDKVVRGRDWKWGEQDGGNGNIGEVTEVKVGGWISVLWNGTKKSRDHRWGKDGMFDVNLHTP